MRHGMLSLLFATLLIAPALKAEETAPTVTPALADDGQRLAALEERLADSERQRAELHEQLQSQSSGEERDGALLTRLRQENQRLKLQLNKALAEQQPQWLDEQQQWFAAGGGVALVGTLFGALLRGRRKTRREWLN
ncbi:hypothetical protein JQX08_08870 [Pseudomonas sp. UL073]|uniref:Translation initiation factor 2 n=1 Tax=Zestomonas insulae TaxID=2809017 RepID=A0ABS2ICM5_9GAMM|nr:hypothetical protein [Pseudomonas insulae]MBM7060822.1 hypothetical protein [Pseudomonas insulae]